MIETLLKAQAVDVLRIGMLIALMFTMLRTQAVTGTILPLAAGILFVAVIIPLTNPTSDAPMWMQVATGIVVNAVYVGIGLAAWTFWKRGR